jgi:hypothetical protein
MLEPPSGESDDASEGLLCDEDDEPHAAAVARSRNSEHRDGDIVEG